MSVGPSVITVKTRDHQILNPIECNGRGDRKFLVGASGSRRPTIETDDGLAAADQKGGRPHRSVGSSDLHGDGGKRIPKFLALALEPGGQDHWLQAELCPSARSSLTRRCSTEQQHIVMSVPVDLFWRLGCRSALAEKDGYAVGNRFPK
jgi:hypothetical protein